MFRKIITPSQRNLSFNIPLEYLNRRVEILILPLEEQNTEEITFWSDEELVNFPNLLTVELDNEDYSKW
ncbi:MAG: hypothetical protein NTW25_15580 [Candidatus Kapabacteria bacterium]|nr:hypothetical protein [Candidatus Kapabacteria bacterium]